MTEKEIASRLAHYMVMEGADTKPYGGIVISGAKSSLLHGIPDSKPIEYGDFVLMDYGCQYKGYLSDMTRTVVVGKADANREKFMISPVCMTEDTEASVRAGVTGTSAMKLHLKQQRYRITFRIIIQESVMELGCSSMNFRISD